MSASGRDDELRGEAARKAGPEPHAALVPPPPRDRDIALGILLGIGLHVVIQGGAMAVAMAIAPESELGMAWIVPLLFWGLTQVTYMLPAYLLVRRRGAHGRARGVAICGLVSFLLWGGCMGLLMVEGRVL